MAEAERLWRIQYMLGKGAVVPRQTFLEELEVSPAQFKRDLSKLRDSFQLEIDYDRDRRGYRITGGNADGEIAPGSQTASFASRYLQHSRSRSS
jgi:predicted DNA-binding transcriptional regulator YafY